MIALTLLMEAFLLEIKVAHSSPGHDLTEKKPKFTQFMFLWEGGRHTQTCPPHVPSSLMQKQDVVKKIRAILIPLPHLYPDSDFDDFLASIENSDVDHRKIY